MSKKILYKFPTRERPEKAFAAIDNIISMSRHDNYEILLTLDIDDESMRGDEVKVRIASYDGKVRAIWGTSEGKIHACNRDMEFAGEFYILCLHSDDQWFVKEGFDLDILQAFESSFSGLVHFPDSFVNERLCTYAMISKDYFDRFGYIYNLEFYSVYADNELQDVAKILNKYKYVNKHIFEHRHFVHGYGGRDDLLKRTEDPANYARDKAIYEKHKLNNFCL